MEEKYKVRLSDLLLPVKGYADYVQRTWDFRDESPREKLGHCLKTTAVCFVNLGLTSLWLWDTSILWDKLFNS